MHGLHSITCLTPADNCQSQENLLTPAENFRGTCRHLPRQVLLASIFAPHFTLTSLNDRWYGYVDVINSVQVMLWFPGII